MIAAALRHAVLLTAPLWGLEVGHYAARYRVAVAEAELCAAIGDHRTAALAHTDAGIAAAGLARTLPRYLGAAWRDEAGRMHARGLAQRTVYRGRRSA